jgi:hypothetical protein
MERMENINLPDDKVETFFQSMAKKNQLQRVKGYGNNLFDLILIWNITDKMFNKRLYKMYKNVDKETISL